MSSNRLKVLIIEDNEDDALLMVRELRRGGYDVHFDRVETSQTLIAAFESQKWDVILSDFSLPSFNAIGALKLVRERDEDIPFILLSGTVGEDIAVQAMKAGAQDFFAKDQMTRLVPAIERELRDAEHRRKRRWAEQELRQSEDRFTKVFQLSPLAVSIGTVADGILLDVNTQYLNLFGYRREEVIGHRIHDLNIWDAYGRRGEIVQLLSQQRTVQNQDLRLRTKTGDVLECLVSFEQIELGDESCILAMIIDITDRKRTERSQKQLTRRLEQQAYQLQMVMDSVPEGVFVIDSKGTILLTNPTAGKDLIALAGGIGVGDRLKQLGENSLATLLAPPPKGFWHQITWQNRNFELIANPLKGNEAETGWVVVIRDVTTEKEVEKRIQQQERLASVGQLAAGIAHDFNNIMGVITLYAEMTLDDPRLPSDLHRRFETISKQSKFAVALIRQILDFARRSTMERLPMNLIPFLSELVKLFERTLPEDIDISLHFSNNDLMINGDPTRLQQALMNLIVNARDAMPEGGVLTIDLERLPIDRISTGILPELTHQLKQKQNPENWVRLTVQDTGTGIPANILPHIFEPFYTTKEFGKGTGLGLAQVFGIIKQHEGEMDVISKEGEGSTFIVYLPLLETDNSEDTMIKSEPFLRGQGEIILVVEDNISMQQVLIDSLELLNYRVQIAKNGREALRFLKELDDEIALVLTDLVMPEMGGKALVQEMKQAGISTKIIIMTGHPLTDEKEAIMALGVEGWLDKPPSLEKLGQAIWYALLK